MPFRAPLKPTLPAEDQEIVFPEKILENAVRGMLPKGPLGRELYKNLKVYKGESHPHTSQNPELLVYK